MSTCNDAPPKRWSKPWVLEWAGGIVALSLWSAALVFCAVEYTPQDPVEQSAAVSGPESRKVSGSVEI